ncbi:hypothetical protein NFI96_001387 [Prochilodus magdalenae]|nr:hypothetical protein NFI96_001387 [Prochilodus magdalenae]
MVVSHVVYESAQLGYLKDHVADGRIGLGKVLYGGPVSCNPSHGSQSGSNAKTNVRPEIQTDKEEDDARDTNQHDFTEDKAQEEATIERWNENKESAGRENNDGNEVSDQKSEPEERNDQSDFIGHNGRPNNTDDDAPQAAAEGEGKPNREDELTEDKRQREVTRGDIIEGEENKQHDIREDIGHNDYIEDVKQLDITKERSAPEENRQQGCSESSGADDTVDNIKGTSKLEPDSEMTVLWSNSDHKEPIKPHKNTLPQTSVYNIPPSTATLHQQVLEKREKAPPARLKSAVRTPCALDQSSEANGLRRITHPTPVILFPSPFTHTHSSPLPHMLPSFYGTSFGYRLRTLQPLRAKTWTTRVSSDKGAVKSTKELLPRGKGAKGNISEMAAGGITGPRPKIMSSEWGAPACKMKTTKTFVWGPRGPQETKTKSKCFCNSKSELHSLVALHYEVELIISHNQRAVVSSMSPPVSAAPSADGCTTQDYMHTDRYHDCP